MLRRYTTADIIVHSHVPAVRRRIPAHSTPVLGGALESERACLGRERALAGKVLVEAALDHAGDLHDVGDADRLDTVWAEQAARDLQDARPVLVGLAPARSPHCGCLKVAVERILNGISDISLLSPKAMLLA